jgi:phosphatidylglycerol:prolipoprotein diacylglycerol transferase
MKTMINAINPVAIDLFGLQIMWYAIFIMMGIVGAVFVGIREGERLGLNKDDLYDGILYCVPLAILGARLYYVIFEFDLYTPRITLIAFSASRRVMGISVPFSIAS